LQKDGGSDVTSYDASVKLSDTSWGTLYATARRKKPRLEEKWIGLLFHETREAPVLLIAASV
jgi:hypothetical protein